MPLPDFLQPFASAAAHLVKQGGVHYLDFSRNTYQAEIQEPNSVRSAWVVMQVDGSGKVYDCLCSLEEAGDLGCVHAAAAYLKILHGTKEPLHIRFERSIWNALCQALHERLGDDLDLFVRSRKTEFVCKDPKGHSMCVVAPKEPKSIEEVEKILEHRPLETEETSLKFSNLPPEEVERWKQGKPSSQVSYLLSFWYDLAKYFFMRQESGESLTVQFRYQTKNGLPDGVLLFFADLEIYFTLLPEDFSYLVPSLMTVPSALKVHEDQYSAISSIVFDPKLGEMKVHFHETGKKRSPPKQKQSIRVGHWNFVPNDGFYPAEEHWLMKHPLLKQDQVGEALDRFFPLVRRKLKGTTIHDFLTRISFDLSFDAKDALHIESYSFTPGDLLHPNSRVFGQWIYIHEKGFYRFSGYLFGASKFVVSKDKMSDFITENRAWLNQQLGFQTHLTGMEAAMTYHVDSSGRLIFTRSITGGEGIRDFGAWLFAPGEGFYARTVTSTGSIVRPGLVIPSTQIPYFVKTHRDELMIIPKFFAEHSPIVSGGLHVLLEEGDSISITPHYKPSQAYVNRPLKFFEDIVYIEGEGFHELPAGCRFPQPYQHEVDIPAKDVPDFLDKEFPKLRPFTSYIDHQLMYPEALELDLELLVEGEEHRRGWYLASFFYRTPAGKVPLVNLWQAMHKKKRYLFTEAGRFDLRDHGYSWFRHISKERVWPKKNVIALSAWELIRLSVSDTINCGEGTDAAVLLKKLTSMEAPGQKPDLTGLNSHLRPYQEHGVAWLWFLYHYGLSGLLCDDMGLGKTHQAMALMAAISNVTPGSKFLVVCPTSVMYHWQEKLAIFVPDINVCVYHGGERSIDEKDEVLLTSYGIWRSEHEKLGTQLFELAIFDELQVAKNHTSRVHLSLKKVNARMKIGLTGTPIENHLGELKALFDIVLPHYLLSDTEYRERFIRPIERNDDKSAKQLLVKMIRPFVLRRKKEQVLIDLPEKIEELAWCEMHPKQQKLYDEVKERSRDKLLRELYEEGTPIPYIHIFALLSALKQICDHPALYLKETTTYQEYSSGKWDLFVELLQEARDSGQKVVVFSHYLGMLDIMESYLESEGIQYATLKGSTMNRGEVIKRFNHDPECIVFLGSLHAAGLGVDLTAGSVVIHYDRWWNAARENQATDRVHRIGQTRGVQVFKLITKGTFEERINELIFQKANLLEDVILADDHQVVKLLNREELISLLT